jgi:AraC-like DNA-binding protein
MRRSPALKLITGVFSDRLMMLILGSSFLLQAFIFFIFFHKKDLTYFPNNNLLTDFYTDSVDAGNSIIEEYTRSDSLLAMSFVLKEGFVRPYVGINLQPKNNSYIDISDYNQVQIVAAGEKITTVVVYLITLNDSSGRDQGRFNELYFCQNIELTPEKKTYKLPINRFKTPDWWYDVNNLSPNDDYPPDWKHVTRINITTGLAPTVDTRRSLALYNICFSRNNTGIISSMCFIQLLIILLMAGSSYIKSKPPKELKEIIIRYKPILVDNQKEPPDSFLEYINQNFQDCELSLKKISKATGISQRSITDGIAGQFNCNVKTYINGIRINEAKRLLKETKLHISEIAYKVGFNSPSNFNRVFKNLTAMSPSEFLTGKE